MKTKMYFILHCFLAVLAAALFCVPAAYSAFDPVNDDTDIFLANPNITAERPNVLIILDNTANWNNAFTNEKSALVSVVNGLTDQFNVGLMMMVETGGGNDNVDGTYVRYHVRQMTDTNKVALSSMVNNLDILGDKGNNNTVGLGLYEAFLYYAGLASNAGHGKAKTDKDGTTDPLLSPLAGLHALPVNPTASSLYRSPIADGCQKNFIIYISNGAANENASARSFIEGKLTTLNGGTVPPTIGITPDGQQGNWGDEMARYIANADVHSSAGTQNVVTYTVEVDPEATGQGPDMTALMKSVATNGKGKYFAVSSSASGVAIVQALNIIFAEVQAVNSVFAASSLPVSVSVRGAFLNQLYVGVFRPDAVKSPRWFGNLKLYAFDQDTATKAVFLVDANGLPAVNPTTGFIAPSAQSFWSASSSFWSFRDATQNGVGGSSDAPDGEVVEKGGVAQQIRVAYAAAEAASPTRNLYTCTTGGSKPDCVANSALSATPFDTTNTAIDSGSLGLGSRNVAPLTGYQSKAITTLTDRKPATLFNASSPVDVTSLSNGATTVSITSLKTSTPKTVSLLSAGVAGTQSLALTSAVTTGTSTKITTVTAGADLTSAFIVGASVTFAGTTSANPNNYNGASYTIATVTGARTFTISGATSNKDATGGTISVPAVVNSTVATATVTAHGYASADQVTIAGATPSQFNGTYGITVTGANTFTYSITPAAGDASGTMTAAANTTTATAITSAAHGLAVSDTVYISGATPSGYNGTFTVATVPNSTTFTYTVGSKLADNTGTPVYMARGGSTTVTATTAAAHLFADGDSVSISGSDIGGYNGAFTISCAPAPACTGATTFTFTTSTVLPANNSITVTASIGFLAFVIVTAPSHGFIAGDTVVIDDGTQPLHNGSFTVFAAITDQLAYFHNPGVAPAGSYTIRPVAASTKAIATVTAHGYANGQQVVISGATPVAYNGTYTISVVDANTFTYPLTAAPGPNTSSSVISKVTSTTASATSVAHGFTTGDSVTISGSTPAAFNGTYTIAVTDVNNFQYTIASAQGDATGTILASGAVSSDRNNLIRWVRGEDNFADENASTTTTDIRSSVHGDTLHSSPTVVNYNRYASNDDVYVFYGSNDGVFRAVKGGYATDATATVQIPPGYEAWGFIPTNFFGSLNRLRTNSPIISSSFKKPYFADGPVSIYTSDANSDDKFVAADGDKVYLYIAMRRGGRFLYALDVSDPHNPKYLWKIDTSSAGFAELGQTWSQARVIPGSVASPGLAGLTYPVLVFGAGYDAAVEDLDPAAITAASAASVTTPSGTVNRSMGRGIYVVNALTGALVWRALGAADATCPTCSTTVVSGMDYAIPSDIAVVRNQSGGLTNRAYVGDTGGNMWRLDFTKDAFDVLSGTVTKIAAVGLADTSQDTSTAALLRSVLRKFQYPPSVVTIKGITTILVGSGDREHPFDTTVANRFYAFKDLGNDLGPVTGTAVATPTIIVSAMFDATTNCIQDASACDGSTDQTATATQTASQVAQAALNAASGWYVKLLSGEKVVGNPVTAAGVVVFGTNQPSDAAGGGTCGSNLGIARLYQISATDATATKDLNASGTITGSDRFQVQAGGGFIPRGDYRAIDLSSGPPTAPCVGANCPKKKETVECAITGFTCTTPGGATLNARLRKYWFKELD
jgi:Tfp pilus tip-associated adhesin PilY1